MKPYLSVVIPAYNEEYNLRTGVLESVYGYLDKQKYSWEILFVDDGSSDATAKIAGEFAKKHNNFFVLKEPHRGKGGTVIAGMPTPTRQPQLTSLKKYCQNLTKGMML
ncbi:MAG: Glycosyl transferase, family 2 [Candidatus Woesebacteria bacterium GW2011_GWD2_40_19]|nr:MAG: Glycosyl transferase, family 2 [Candidatus Woesebacteria bacterium GW2011_GWD2_40_19]